MRCCILEARFKVPEMHSFIAATARTAHEDSEEAMLRMTISIGGCEGIAFYNGRSAASIYSRSEAVSKPALKPVQLVLSHPRRDL